MKTNNQGKAKNVNFTLSNDTIIVKTNKFKYSSQVLIEGALTKNYLDLKYYLVSYIRNSDKKILVN